MELSERGRKSLKMREGERLLAYQDSKGIWTIGVGHVAPYVIQGLRIDQKESDSFFNADVAWAERSVSKNVTVNISQDQFDALVSFTFNVGPTAFKESTLLKELNKGNYFAVPAQLMRWNKITVDGRKRVLDGLVKRRDSEVSQWNGVYVKCQACPTSPDEPTGRSFGEVASTSKTVKTGIAVIIAGVYSLWNSIAAKASATFSSVLLGGDMIYFIVIGLGIYIIRNRLRDSRLGRSY